jgi:hypothetical protein
MGNKPLNVFTLAKASLSTVGSQLGLGTLPYRESLMLLFDRAGEQERDGRISQPLLKICNKKQDNFKLHS